jgi:pimeloyl-ACP methyl ester carboxylesterase
VNLAKTLCFFVAVLLLVTIPVGCDGTAAREFTESEVSFETEDSAIAGTLAVPAGAGPFPAAIVLAGSGAFDRNGDLDAALVEASKQAGVPYITANSTYRDIAHGLSEAGLVTLRYDKRGIGSSTGDRGDFPEESLRDLEAAVSFLRGHPSVRSDRIALVGHSIGGLWVLMAAAEDADIAALCLLATPAKPFGEVIVEQIEGLLTLGGANETRIESVVAQQRAIYELLRSGLLDLATLSEDTRSQMEFVEAVMDLAGADYARQILSPVLILQGGKDLFTIIPEEAELLEEAFVEGGNKQAELIVFPDLDHLFRPTPDNPSPELYYEDRGPIHAEVLDTIADWLTAALR